MNRRQFLNTTTGALLSAAVLTPLRRLWAAPDSTNEMKFSVPVKRKPADAKWEPMEARTPAQLPGFETGASSLPRSIYGGWLAHRVEATGFFRVEKRGDRWWLVDPEGCLFLSAGVNSVRLGKSDAARETVGRRFGTVQKWADAAVAQLRENGFNTIGSWSDTPFLRAAPQPLAYCEMVAGGFMGSFGKKLGVAKPGTGHANYPHNAMPVFHPDFAAFCDGHAQSLAARRDDPWLIGYFSDNELPTPKLENYLALDANDAAMGSTYKEARDWLRARRGSNETSELTKDESEAWMEHVYDRYFALTTAAIRRHDPHHLCLGSRLYAGEKNVPGALRAAGRHLDVISLNHYYSWNPEPPSIERWTDWSGKPVMITEWYAKGMDSGLPNVSGAGWTVPTQRDRGLFYQTFTLALLQTTNCVGWHWFKYIDNDPTDTTADASNRDSNKGIVSVDFRPYEPLLEQMRSLNQNIYAVREYFQQKFQK